MIQRFIKRIGAVSVDDIEEMSAAVDLCVGA